MPEQPDDERQLSYGEDAVGLAFNPSGNELVDQIKKKYAEVIDLLDDERKKVENPSEKGAYLTLAIREAQGAQMWAVKAVTRKK